MEPQPDSEELITPILNFKFDVGRIQVPVSEVYPSGEGIIVTIAEPLDDANPRTDWVSKHYLMPPDACRTIGQGFIDTADETKVASKLFLPDGWDNGLSQG